MDTVRIDKWLWAARFFKTRSLAAQAVSGGHISLNGNKVKPAKTVQAGDLLVIKQGHVQCTLQVMALSEQRGPAASARMLYQETEESVVQREHAQMERKLLNLQAMRPDHRPDKHERRKIRRFLKKE